MEHERPDVEVLTDYFTELYRSEDGLEKSARNLLGDFYMHQGLESEEIDVNNLSEAIQNSSEEYDWNLFKDQFQIFLEKRLDRYHNGSIENPETTANDLETERHYSLGYIETDIASPDTEEVFMTSIIQFEEPENETSAIEVEYLETGEGLEAVEHLLEHDRETVRELIEFGMKINPDRATQAYKVVAQEEPGLARALLKNLAFRDESLESSMKSIYFKNNPEIFENFRDELDF